MLFHFSSLLLSLWNSCFPLFCLHNKEPITVIGDYVTGFDGVQLDGYLCCGGICHLQKKGCVLLLPWIWRQQISL